LGVVLITIVGRALLIITGLGLLILVTVLVITSLSGSRGGGLVLVITVLIVTLINGLLVIAVLVVAGVGGSSGGLGNGGGHALEDGAEGGRSNSDGLEGGGGLLSGRGGGSDGGSRGSGRRLGGTRSGAGAGASADDKVNARLVGLVDIRSIPEPLENTVSSLGALTTQALGKSDAEGSVVGVETSVGSIVLKLDKRLSDHLISGGLDNGDVGVTGVRSSNVDVKVNLLTELVALDIVLVVVELEALAQPEVAVLGVKVGSDDLLDALDVAVDVGALLVEGLLAASSLEGVAGLAGRRRLDEAVGGDEGKKSKKGGGVLHFGGR
jgi:hypothetical protein